MELREPVAVFDADTNLEAQLVRTLLVDAGIEAFASPHPSRRTAPGATEASCERAVTGRRRPACLT